MKFKLYICILSLFFCLPSGSLFSQVKITVPMAADTVLCNGGPLTLHAVSTGRTATSLTVSAFESGDDGYTNNVIPLGFSFNFYGNTYTQCVISDNGFISFDISNAAQYSEWELDGGEGGIPGNQNSLNSIMACYADILLESGGTIDYATVGTAPNRKFVVTFCTVAMFSCTSQIITMQMVLYETTNLAECYIKKKQICSDWNSGFAIEGVQNASGSAATVVPGRNNTTWTAANDGQRFTPNSTLTVYADSVVPYEHIPKTTDVLMWFQGNPISGPVLATGDSLTVNPPVTTTYTVLAVDCGDTSFASVTVTIGLTPVISGLVPANPSVCGACDGTITLQGLTPGSVDTIFYSKNGVTQPPVVDTVAIDGTALITGLSQGAYSNIVAKAGACTSLPAGPVTLTNPPFVINSVTYTAPTCTNAFDASITLNGLTPNQNITINYDDNGVPQPPINTITLANGTATISGLDTGTYSNIVLTLNSCSTCITNPAGPVALIAPPPITITNITFTNPNTCGACNGTITLYGIPPGQLDSVFYNLNGTPQPPLILPSSNDSTITMSGLCEGTYDNIYEKQSTCPSTVAGPVTLTAPPLIPTFTYAIHYGCHGDTVVFTNTSQPLGTVFYRWDFGDNTDDTSFNATHIYAAQGVFNATLFITNHICSDSLTDTISLVHPLSASFTLSGDTSCQGQQVTFTNTSVGSSPSYMWNFGDGTTDITTSPVHTYNNSGTYTVLLTETDFVPCTDTASILVHIDSASYIYLGVSDSVICAGRQITFTGYYSGIGNTGITWTFGDGNALNNVNPVLHSYDSPGTYAITATANYRACPDVNVTKSVTVLPFPMINIGHDTSMCPNSGPITITDSANIGNPLITWLWNTGATTAGITVTQPGLYYTTVTLDGCANTDSVLVKNDCYINIPNAFTPNGDGVNDYFFPRQMLSSSVTAFSMSVYNRWGQLIFETTNTDGRGWDGRFNNEMQPAGVYVYIIDVSFKDGQKEHHQGTVTLLD